MADRNTYFLRNLHKVDEQELRETYDNWLDTIVFENAVLSTRESVALDNHELHVSTKRMHVMVELLRIRCLLSWDAWMTEHNVLRGMRDPPRDPHAYNLLWSISMTQSPVWAQDGWNDAGLWQKPVAQYTQQDVMTCIQYLCERLLDMPSDTHTMQDVQRLMDTLMVHTGRMFCTQSTLALLNVENMRTVIDEQADRATFNHRFAMFCSIYFYPVLRKLRLYRLFWPKRMTRDELNMLHFDACVDATRTWFRKQVCDSLGTDAFEDCYIGVLQDAYNVPGDDEWFQFCFPELAVQRGAVLRALRANLATHFFSEDRVTKNTVCAAAEQYRHGFAARAFVLHALNDYMCNHCNFQWYNYVVIDEFDFEQQSIKLYREPTPFLIRIMSRYWVYDSASWPGENAYVWPTDCIYTAIAVWFHIVRTRYHGVCMGVQLNPIIDRVFATVKP